MWLLPAISSLAAFASRVFYRFEVTGPRPPESGPLLLLANHPNSLFDPALVAAAAARSVRFLAKSTLFTDPRVGWLVRASGAIPVYRHIDGEAAVADKNVAMFAAVFDALAKGAAIGIFPEGISHSDPSLARLKTGAARMALGAPVPGNDGFPLIPVGLILRDKGVFRSQALAVLGKPIVWADLAAAGDDDIAAVRLLTDRIDNALRQVTLNLERWEDRPLIESAEAIWASEFGPSKASAGQVRRSQVAAAILADLRRQDQLEWTEVARQLTKQSRRLASLGLKPADLSAPTDLVTSLRWAVRRLHLLMPPAFVLAAMSAAVSAPPYLLTDLIVRLVGPGAARSSTYKGLVGALLHLVWLGVLVGAFWWWQGPWAGLLTAVIAPGFQLLGLWIRERWRGAWRDVQRFFTLQSRQDLVERLQNEQSWLAQQLDRLYNEWSDNGLVDPGQRVEIDIAARDDDADPLSAEVEPSGEQGSQGHGS